MATVFKIAGKNTGKDVNVTITDSLGNQVNAAQLGILTHFSVERDYSSWTTKSLVNGGAVFNESIPHNAKCLLKFSRYSSALEDMESLYSQQSQNGVQMEYTITYQTQNRDGTINTRQLIHGKPLNWKLGDYNPDQDVAASVDFLVTDVVPTGTGSGLFGQ